VRFDGVEITELPDDDLTLLRRERVGFVFQFFNLLPTLDARENIELPLAIAGKHPDAAWFDQVIGASHLGDRLTHRPAELSGGQQQRAAIARALMNRPYVAAIADRILFLEDGRVVRDIGQADEDAILGVMKELTAT
jgi:putative ABC transport system ATP-binding protein